jgi:hypothetical protein
LPLGHSALDISPPGAARTRFLITWLCPFCFTLHPDSPSRLVSYR